MGMIEFEDHTDDGREALLAFLNGAPASGRVEWGAVGTAALALLVVVAAVVWCWKA
jgi:hypothetical protein